MDDSIGAVIIDVKSDISYLVKGMQKAEGVVEKSASVMLNTAKLITTGYAVISFQKLIDESARLANEQGKIAQKYAMGVEELTKWQYTTNKAGVTNEQFNDSVKDMSKNITDFQRDGSGAEKAFKSLGITQDFAKKSMTNTSDSMSILLQKLGEMPPSMERTTIAMELFGEEVSSMIRVADLGAEAIASFNEEAIKGNIAVSDSFYQKSAAYIDAQHRLDSLQSGFADAVIEESKFLEASTSMYQLLGDAQLEWTANVQEGNNVFVNGLEEISVGSVAVFPEVMQMTEHLGNAVVTTGTAVIELADLAFSPLIDTLDLFLGASNENITMLATFSAYAIGSTMAIENFATLVRLGVTELEVFSLTIKVKVMSAMDSVNATMKSSSASFSEFLNTISFGELGQDYHRLALEAEKYELQSKATTLQGIIEIDVLRKKQMALIDNIHSIKDIDLAMETTAINVSLRQKEGLEFEVKKRDAYKSTALTGVSALDKLQNKHDSLSKSATAHTKSLKSNATAYKDAEKAIREREKALLKFENTYKQSTMSDFDYKLELLDKEKAEYVAIGAERLKVDAWYIVEFGKLQDAKAEKANKIAEEIARNNESWSNVEQKQNADFHRYTTDKATDDFYNSPAGVALQTFGVQIKETTDGAIMPFKDAMKEYADEIPSLLSNLAANAFQDISATYAETGDIQGAVDSYTDSNALRDGLKNSGNPQLAMIGYGAELISGAMSEPMDEFQSMAGNIHDDNKSIKDSMTILENVAYPHLDVARKSMKHLENIERSFGTIGKVIAYGAGSFATGEGYENSISLHGNQDVIEGGNLFGNLFGKDNEIAQLHTAVTNAILGETTKSLHDSGIMAEAQTANQFISNLDAQQYQIIEEKKKYLFGLIKATSYESNFQDLNSNVLNEFQNAYSEGVANILEAGISLGFDENVLAESLGNHLTEEMKLSLKGLSDVEIAEKIQGWFGNEFNTLVDESLPQLERLRIAGEDSLTALTRVATGFESMNYSLERIGISALALENIETNKDLALLNVDTTAFVDNFMTDKQQSDIQLHDLESALGSVNLEVPKTKDAFYDLVYSLDLNTTEGKEMYNTMMNSAGAFSTYRDGINSIDEAFSSMIQGLRDSQAKYAPVQQYTSDGIYESIANGTDNSTIEGQIGSWYDAQLASINKNSSYQVTIDNSHNKALNEEIKLQNTLADKITETQKSVENDLFKTLMGGNLTEQKYNLDNQLSLGDWDGISSAYSDILSTGKSNSGTESDYFSLISRANEKIQAVDAPSKQGLLDESIKTTTYTRDTSNAVKALDLKAYNMYEALILENENSIKQSEGIELVAVTFQAGEQKTRDMLDLNFKATNAIMNYSSKMDIKQNSDMKDMVSELRNLKKEMESLKKTQEAQNKISYENLKITKIDNAKADADRRIKA